MLYLTTILLSLSSLALSLPLIPAVPPGNSHLRTIYQFPNETWVENMAVRSNGNLLVTLITPSPDVWEVDPVAQTAQHIYTFPNATSVLGIAEYAPDVFAVNVGNFSVDTLTATEGSWSVWSIDMSTCGKLRGEHAAPEGPTVKKLTDIPEAAFLNGMASLPSNPSTILLADSKAGVVYSLDTKTADYHVAIKNVHALTPAPNAALILGVNGLQFRPNEPGMLYWTNGMRNGHFGRIAIDPLTGDKAGKPEVLVKHKQSGVQDDFTFDAAGDAWLMGSPQDTVVRLAGSFGGSGWEETVVVHKTAVVAEPTACKFGRTEGDAETLYVVTTGGFAEALPQGIKGGVVVALDTAAL